MSAPAMLATVARDGFVESTHYGHVAVAAPSGALLGGMGDPEAETYPRSALKPLQTVATLEALAEAGLDIGPRGIAIASASHEASATHQVEAAYLLARAGLDESALRCPPARPAESSALTGDPAPTTLAHNCSGKHAGFLLAHTASGGAPDEYLLAESGLQRRVRDVVAGIADVPLAGPGVDGCGAPAWRMSLAGLAAAFARLAVATCGGLGRVREAMVAQPELVGGFGAADTVLMRAQPGLVAKRGAEGVLGVGWLGPRGPVGVAVKVADGASRATGPVAGTVLEALGACVPEEVRAPAVLGGGLPHGRVSAAAEVLECGAAIS